MNMVLKVMTGLCLGIIAVNPAGAAAENFYAVVSQAPNENDRIRVVYEPFQGAAPQEMDVALIPEDGKKKSGKIESDIRAGDQVVIGFEENESTGMYEMSLTKVNTGADSQKEMK